MHKDSLNSLDKTTVSAEPDKIDVSKGDLPKCLKRQAKQASRSLIWSIAIADAVANRRRRHSGVALMDFEMERKPFAVVGTANLESGTAVACRKIDVCIMHVCIA